MAVDGVTLDIAAGEFFSLLGPSGCGKTTSLRMIAGFELPDSGRVHVAGRDITDLPVHKRDMGMVFQSYALFPHRTVAENVAFGLRMREVPKPEIERRVKAALAQVALTGLEERKPGQLSGGQQQRVALARALVVEPPVLLCDEPLGALDRKLRQQMQFELKELQKRLGVTLVFVTHDQEEALAMSDRIAVMNHGKVEQVGAPTEIYERPRTRFVADFIGEINILEEARPRPRAAAGEDPPGVGAARASRAPSRPRISWAARRSARQHRRRPLPAGARDPRRRTRRRASRVTPSAWRWHAGTGALQDARPVRAMEGVPSAYDRAMSTLGIVTIGQAPRDDIAALFAAHAPRRHQGDPARRARRAVATPRSTRCSPRTAATRSTPACAAAATSRSPRRPSSPARRQRSPSCAPMAATCWSMPAPASSRRCRATRTCCSPRAC